MPGPGSPGVSTGKCKSTVKKKKKIKIAQLTQQAVCEEAGRGFESKAPAGLRDQEAHAGRPVPFLLLHLTQDQLCHTATPALDPLLY